MNQSKSFVQRILAAHLPCEDEPEYWKFMMEIHPEHVPYEIDGRSFRRDILSEIGEKLDKMEKRHQQWELEYETWKKEHRC